MVFTDDGGNTGTTGVIIDGTNWWSIELSGTETITATKITNRDTTYGRGDHAVQGYLTTESDPRFTAHSGDYYTTGESDSKYLTGEIWTKNGTDAFYTGGKVGIGTDSPTAALDVNRSWRFNWDIILWKDSNRTIYVENPTTAATPWNNIKTLSANGSDGGIAGKDTNGGNAWDNQVYAGNGGDWGSNGKTNWWDGGNIQIYAGDGGNYHDEGMWGYWWSIFIEPWTKGIWASANDGNVIISELVGKVGIGTNTPSTKLEIYNNSTSTSPTIELEQWNTFGDSSMRFITNGGNIFTMWIDASDSDKFKISDNTILWWNDRLTIQSDWNIWIGTAQPNSRLQVDDGYLQIDSNISSSPNPPNTDCDSSSELWRMKLIIDNDATWYCKLYICAYKGQWLIAWTYITLNSW